MDAKQLERTMRSRGWIQAEDGSWSPGKGGPRLGPVEAHCSKPAALRPLDQDPAKQKGSASGLAAHVTCLAFRRRLLDNHDAVAYSMKPLTDAIASTLGLDDADPRLIWEYGQQQTRGEEGVLVKVAFYRAGPKKG